MNFVRKQRETNPYTAHLKLTHVNFLTYVNHHSNQVIQKLSSQSKKLENKSQSNKPSQLRNSMNLPQSNKPSQTQKLNEQIPQLQQTTKLKSITRSITTQRIQKTIHNQEE